MGSQAADVAGKVYEEATATGKKLGDNLSGAEAQARIAALVEQQRRYNDILATRLAEALDRIEKLETHVARLSRGSLTASAATSNRLGAAHAPSTPS